MEMHSVFPSIQDKQQWTRVASEPPVGRMRTIRAVETPVLFHGVSVLGPLVWMRCTVVVLHESHEQED